MFFVERVEGAAARLLQSRLTHVLTDVYRATRDYKAMLERSPLRRMATADDISAAAMFLVSPLARNISGQVLPVNGGALTSCECGSRNWLPPDGIYQLVAVAGRLSSSAAHRIPTKAIVPLTCAACGFTKLYDPAVVASLAESTGRW